MTGKIITTLVAIGLALLVGTSLATSGKPSILTSAPSAALANGVNTLGEPSSAPRAAAPDSAPGGNGEGAQRGRTHRGRHRHRGHEHGRRARPNRGLAPTPQSPSPTKAPTSSPAPTQTPTTGTPTQTSGSGGGGSGGGGTTVTQPAGGCISSGRATVGGSYVLQANEYRSSAPFSVCPTGSDGFTVQTSAISTGGNGVQAYPSVYKGDHWNQVSPGDPFPIPISQLGSVSTSVSTVADAPGSWDDAYDTFFSSSGDSNPNQIEVMVWLTHQGQNQPAGQQVATNVNIGGHTWNIWDGGHTITYVSSQPVTSLSFNFGPIAQDLVSRGYVPAGDSLTDVEQGFEIWSGGQGLQTTSFTVNT